MSEKKYGDTSWYDDLCLLYQKTKIPELRNVLWEQVKLLLYSRVRGFINEKKSAILKKDPDLCQQLYQDVFFIFQKACDIWDPSRKTKFLTFLGDIVDQEILNIIRLNLYHKSRDNKIKTKLNAEFELPVSTTEDFEKEELLSEVKQLFENFSFNSMLERDIVYTTVYGKSGDWSRLQKKSKKSIADFFKLRTEVMEKLKKHVLDNCSPRMKEILQNVLEEK